MCSKKPSSLFQKKSNLLFGEKPNISIGLLIVFFSNYLKGMSQIKEIKCDLINFTSFTDNANCDLKVPFFLSFFFEESSFNKSLSLRFLNAFNNMIAETTYLETTATKTMVATDQNTDFTNCENKSETLNVVNGNFSFRSTVAKLNEPESELDIIETNEDVTDYGRPKKLQKSVNNQNLIGNNLINQQQQQIDNDNLKSKINLLTENDQANNNQSNQQQQQQSSRRRQNLIDTECEDNFGCLIAKDSNNQSSLECNSPKVPPLRIVISASSTAGRSSKDHLSQSNNPNYVVSTTSTLESQTSSSSNNDKKEDNNFYLTRSLGVTTTTVSNNNNSAQPNSSSNSINTATSSSVRITRSQRAAALHLTNDDSQSRYSPDEFNSTCIEFNGSNNSNDIDEQSQPQQQQTQTIYLNSQNLKESNKENKDLRRRKGRGKGLQASNNLNATPATTSATTNSISAGSNLSNSNNNNNSSSGVSSPIDSTSLNDEQMATIDQSMLNLSSVNISSRDYQMPAYNCYNRFQSIRKQIEKRRQTMCDSFNPKASTQKPPQGFKNYLLTTGNYLLAENRNESKRSVNPNLTFDQIDVPEQLVSQANANQLIELYKDQALERERLRVQHLVEREKVKLSIEQEILRVHNRAALAMANQSLPFSFTVLLKDEEIYNPLDQDQEHYAERHGINLESNSNQKESTTTKNEYSRATYSYNQSNNTYADLFTLTGKSEDIGSRCRYSGRLLHSWLQDVAR